MFGIIYIVLSLLAGKELAEILLFTGKNAQEAGSRNGQHKAFCNQIWVLAAAAFGMGTLVFGWTTYMISWAASEAGAKKPLIYGNTAVLIITAVVLVLLYWKRYRKTGTVWTVADRKLISDSRAFRKECILFGFLLVFLTWIMFYVFYIRNGELYSGFSVYGDYAPHTAMMRSFSKGNNFPTEYPHFGGQDVKYHFMFQFLVGNLEFLGIRLDFAYNIESVLALLGFLMFNSHPAKVFMGDTGSLALGGFVSASAFMMQIPLFIPIIGLIYLVEVLSVIMQVSYFKATHGKRIFRMAPIHHHFELGGWSETRVVAVFSIVTALLCLVAYLGL